MSSICAFAFVYETVYVAVDDTPLAYDLGGPTVIRVIISPTRSGSTALLRCFENNPSVDRVFHQPVKSGYRTDGTFDYSFYGQESLAEERVFVAKETIGGFEPPEAWFSPLPDDHEGSRSLPSTNLVERIKPLVLVRDPLQTWASIERLNRFSNGISPYHSPLEYFMASYVRVIEFLQTSREAHLPVYSVTQEMLGARPAEVTASICAKWNLAWSSSMVNWRLDYGVKTWYSEETRDRMENDPRFRRSKESLEASSAFAYVPSDTSFLPTEDVQQVKELLPLYKYAASIAAMDFPVRNSMTA